MTKHNDNSSSTPKSPSQEDMRAMYPLSFDLLGGSYFFADAANAETDDKRRRYYNTSCIVFAAATIEAVLNEQLSLRNVFGSDNEMRHIPKEYFAALANAQKAISLRDKWNLFVTVRGGRPWDSSQEPFQSYDLIITIRNELLHYKAEFLAHMEAPIRKLQPLIERFCPTQNLTTMDEVTVWLNCLLESRELGSWVKEKLRYNELLDYVLMHKS
jgi:hypothetical protein